MAPDRPNPGDPHTATGGRTLWAAWGAPALLAAAAIAAYAGTFRVPFVLDDNLAIVSNASIRHWGTALFAPAGGATTSGRPLLNLSFAVNYAIGGLSVESYHVANLLVLILSAWVLYGIVRRTLVVLRPVSADALPPRTFALAIALIWMLHPVQTEAVTYVAQRAESLMGLFYLLTLYFFVKSIEVRELTEVERTACRGKAQQRRVPRALAVGNSGGPESARGTGRSTFFAVGSIVFCALGMLTKETMATAPLMVLLFDRAFVAGSIAAAWRARWRFYLALAATWLVLAALTLSSHGRGHTAGFNSGVSWGKYFLNQFPAVAHYLKVCLWPSGLVFDFGTALRWNGANALPWVILVGALVAAAVWALVRRPRAGFLGAWFFGILAPTSLIPVATEPVAEHRLYLPIAAVAVGVGVALFAALGRRSLPVLLAIAAVLGWTTVRRNAVYRDEERLWRDTLAKCPDSERAHNNLGNVLARDTGRLPDAIAQYEEALRLRPTYAEAHFNLGLVLERIPGRLGDAIAQYEDALRLKPDFAPAHNKLGDALLDIPGQREEAIAQLREAVRLDPADPGVHNSLGCALADTPDGLGAAIAQFEDAVRLNPRDPAIHFNLALALLKSSGGNAEAAENLSDALRLDPGNTAARELLRRISTAQTP